MEVCRICNADYLRLHCESDQVAETVLLCHNKTDLVKQGSLNETFFLKWMTISSGQENQIWLLLPSVNSRQTLKEICAKDFTLSGYSHNLAMITLFPT